MVQDIAWFVSLGLMGLVAIVFAGVCLGAGTQGRVERPYRGRAWLFSALLLGGLVVAFATLTPWPHEVHATGHAKPVKTIHVVGHQWRWELSATEVPVGQPVEFVLTAADVNHGFAVYGSKDRMLGQVQAMPGFSNRLVLTFPAPGTYEVLCLEYCGIAHHAMVATLTAR